MATFGRASRPPAPQKAAKPVITSEARRARRQRTLLRGKLAYGSAAFSVDCVISDLSETGARVQVQAGATVPEQVYLVHLRTRTAYESKVVWHRDNFVGLEFKSAHDLETATSAEMKLMRLFCVDNAPRWAGISSDEF
jgi:hypothetical protein